ncbi:hypothetical protein AVEN_223497-1 [Araneus ventricosus]|uniref:Uncharacterized protein n=1 Tax=Araneus ventricosus TaxID=182803 RepID=A0A4Y2DLQ6_ARAVE|nr:hypothetical protein AVEN_223497-1 [Araneus ventricosus]
MKDRPPRHHSQALRFLHYEQPYYEQPPLRAANATTPRFTGVRPVFGDVPKEPHHHYCTIGLARVSLLIRQHLIRGVFDRPSYEIKLINIGPVIGDGGLGLLFCKLF